MVHHRASLLVAAARCICLEARGIPRVSGDRFTSMNKVLRHAVKNLDGLWTRLKWGMVEGEDAESFATSVHFELCAFYRTLSHLYDGLPPHGRVVLDGLLCDARDVVGAIEEGNDALLMRLIEKMRPEPSGDMPRQIPHLETEAAVA